VASSARPSALQPDQRDTVCARVSMCTTGQGEGEGKRTAARRTMPLLIELRLDVSSSLTNPEGPTSWKSHPKVRSTGFAGTQLDMIDANQLEQGATCAQHNMRARSYGCCVGGIRRSARLLACVLDVAKSLIHDDDGIPYATVISWRIARQPSASIHHAIDTHPSASATLIDAVMLDPTASL